jgi:hypothetical protein
MSMTNAISKNTHELVKGDVVWCHGVRFLIDREILTSRSHPVINQESGECRYTKAKLIDPIEKLLQCDDLFARFVRTDGYRWTIQGNKLATWLVEVK